MHKIPKNNWVCTLSRYPLQYYKFEYHNVPNLFIFIYLYFAVIWVSIKKNMKILMSYRAYFLQATATWLAFYMDIITWNIFSSKIFHIFN